MEVVHKFICTFKFKLKSVNEPKLKENCNFFSSGEEREASSSEAICSCLPLNNFYTLHGVGPKQCKNQNNDKICMAINFTPS